MKFNLQEANGILGLYALGFSVPYFIDFMLLSLEESPRTTIIPGIIGAIAFICGIVLMLINIKNTPDSQANPNTSLLQFIFLGTILLNLILIAIGMLSTGLWDW